MKWPSDHLSNDGRAPLFETSTKSRQSKEQARSQKKKNKSRRELFYSYSSQPESHPKQPKVNKIICHVSLCSSLVLFSPLSLLLLFSPLSPLLFSSFLFSSLLLSSLLFFLSSCREPTHLGTKGTQAAQGKTETEAPQQINTQTDTDTHAHH